MDRTAQYRELYSCELDELLLKAEEEHLEFKAAQNSFSYDKLREYCVALANEGGGIIVLGVSDRRPRQVVGTSALIDFRAKLHSITAQFGIRVEAREEWREGKRVLRVNVPSHPAGVPLQIDGKYLMRSGESLVPMTSDQLRSILNQVEPDFSAHVCKQAHLRDLDPVAVARFRALWEKRSAALFIANLPELQMLRDAELVIEDSPSYAALILLGSKEAVGRLLPQAEVIFEFRTDDDAIRHQQRVEFREGFLSYQERLWDTINLRNEVQQVQDGFFMRDVQTFNEVVVREAILNAVSHRDYRLQGSIFVRQYGRKLEVSSPGGFPPGITSDNLLYKQFARNRRLAEALQKCGLIERSGQGVDTIYRQSLNEGKNLPDYSSSDVHEVLLRLDGQVHDPRFVRFLEKISAETDLSVTTDDAMLLDQVNRSRPIADPLKPRLSRLIDLGVVERHGSGRGTKYILSRRFYTSIGRPGSYTHKRGLDRSHRKALILSHLRHAGEKGAKLAEMQDVIPSATLDEIRNMLKELKEDGSARLIGKTNGARWYA